ncbi:hypothetical protein GCM10022255_095070 [Dactylosporangium darangshiense]|uniref:Secreted protein n=1 Tax=Dactylosporangium darangshiense TaxID=579108 RepID=A0ABP8DQ91_9ACTN
MLRLNSAAALRSGPACAARSDRNGGRTSTATVVTESGNPRVPAAHPATVKPHQAGKTHQSELRHSIHLPDHTVVSALMFRLLCRKPFTGSCSSAYGAAQAARAWP